MERKEFIKRCCSLSIGSIAAVGLIESCASNYYAVTLSKNDQLVIAKSEFVQTKDGVSTQRKYVLIRSEKLSFPLCIYKLNENTYSALLMECTHKSCELNPHGDYLICPCHGSEFNHLGIVQNPPAEINLQSFKITHDHDNVYIFLS